MSEVQSGADLSRLTQVLPTSEDLLETVDGVPIIRMLNALLTQAARDSVSDTLASPTNANRAYASALMAACLELFGRTGTSMLH